MPMPSAPPVAARGRKIVLLPDHAFFVRLVPLASGTAEEAIPGAGGTGAGGPVAVSPRAALLRMVPRARRRAAPGLRRLPAPVHRGGRGLLGRRGCRASLVRRLAWTGPRGAAGFARERARFPDGAWLERTGCRAVRGGDPASGGRTRRTRNAPRRARSLVAQLAGLPAPIEIAAPAGTESGAGDEVAVFSSGPFTSRLTTAQLDALDVRDKAELVSRRRERERGLRLWRIFAGCLACAGPGDRPGTGAPGRAPLAPRPAPRWRRPRLPPPRPSRPAGAWPPASTSCRRAG